MKKKIAIVLSALFMFCLIGCENNDVDDTTLEISASTNSGIPYFTINTNLPDETVLEVEVSKVADTGNGAVFEYCKEEKIIVKNGKAETGKFSDEGKSLSGSYSVSVSTLYMNEQPSSVRESTEDGEKLKGDLVNTNEYLDNAIYVRNSEFFTFDYDETASIEPGEEKAVVNEHLLSISNNIAGKIESTIRQRVSDKYDNTDITKITVNEDAGTDNPDDYIALVYLKWNVKNSESTSEEMLSMYSNDLAATVSEEYEDVQEITIFWEVPYLTDNTSKWTFERKEKNMYLTDSIIGW